MEKSVMDLPEILKEQFGGETADIRTYSPLVLAYIGDGIYDLVIRTLIVRHGSCQPNKLHKRTSALVKASAQSEMIDKLMESLTEEELAVYKRGRNAKSYTMAKNATMKDYRKATGFEALIRAQDAAAFSHLEIEPASIDEIVVFTSKEGETHA